VHSFVLATLLEGGAVGTMAAAACQRWAPRPRTWFVALAVVGTVASWLPLASDASTATMVVLSISHLVAALTIVPALALSLPQVTSTLLEQVVSCRPASPDSETCACPSGLPGLRRGPPPQVGRANTCLNPAETRNRVHA
jgi:Family of unknown function (DUF6069)